MTKFDSNEDKSASKPAAPDIKVKNPKFKDGFQRFDWLCSLLPEGTDWGDALDPNVLDDILLAASPAAPSPTPVVLDERAAFEASFKAWVGQSISFEKVTDEEGDERYVDEWLHGAWIGWQARAASHKITECEILRCNDCGSFDIEREETDAQTLGQSEGITQAKQIEQYVLSVLPSIYYMDLPDGGDVSVLEQLRRMADDAAKYRAAPPVEQTRALTAAQIEDLQEAREILENMVRSVEIDGNYSTEATCTFLRQALLCLPAARPASGETE